MHGRLMLFAALLLRKLKAGDLLLQASGRGASDPHLLAELVAERADRGSHLWHRLGMVLGETWFSLPQAPCSRWH